MNVTLNTLSYRLTLDETLARLAAAEPVDGLALFGLPGSRPSILKRQPTTPSSLMKRYSFGKVC